MSQRDDLYQEGIILGDFVVSEFSNSPIVMRILNQNSGLRDRLIEKLKTEISDYRQQCLNALRMCEFVDKTPPATPSKPVFVPPSPSQVSRSTLEALMALPLEQHKFGRQKIQSSASSQLPTVEKRENPKPVEPQPKSSSHALVRSGLFSGLTVEDDSSSEERPVIRLKPETILESAFPAEIFGVLDRENLETRKLNRNKKRKRALTEGMFTKEGAFNAIAYGGFVHLCGGALEWPFRTAEINFIDFFRTNRGSLPSIQS
jgi:hypothetical protein